MANMYFKLDCTSKTTFISSLKNALVTKYGDDVTIHYESEYLIFSCPAISDKVIRINNYQVYYGDSYSSGTAVDNYQRFLFTYSSTYTFIESHLVLGDSFLFMSAFYSSQYRNDCIIAKTIGGKSLICGFTGYDSNADKNITKDVTNDLQIKFVGYDTAVFCDVNVPYKSKLLIVYPTVTGDNMVRNSDGTEDTIKDLYMSYYRSNLNGFVVTNKALFSNRNMYANSESDGAHLLTSILAEF